MASIFQTLQPLSRPHLTLRVLLCLSCVSAATFGQDKITLGVPEITGHLTQNFDSGGIYDKVFQGFASVDAVFAPYSRLDRLFASKQIDCLFPQSEASLALPSRLIESMPVTTVSAFAFSKLPYSRIDELKFKRIALRRGMTLGGIRQTLDATYVELDNDGALKAFLEKDRVDAFITYLPDVQSLYQSQNETLPFYHPEIPVATVDEFIVCHDTVTARAFISAANIAILEHSQRAESQ